MLKYNPRTGEWEGITGGVDVNRKPAPKIAPKEVKQEQIRQEILKDEFYAYALRLTEHISKEMNVKMGRSIFRNRKASCYNPQTKSIWFSYESVKDAWCAGFAEYSTVGHVWVKNGYRPVYRPSYWIFQNGKQAVWMIVLHEMAHRIQHDSQGSFRYDRHGSIFQKELNDLIVLFPYSEVESI